MPENITDLSDKSWTDLYGTDDEDGVEHSILRELAGEREGVNGNGSREEICVGLFAYEGRAGEIPDAIREANAGTVEAAIEARPAPTAPTEDDRELDDDDEDTGRNETLDRDDTPKASKGASFIIDAGRFQTWLEYIEPLVDECKVHLTEDGLWVRAVDPANVGMVDTRLYHRAFESYSVGSEGLIGINLDRLIDVSKAASADDLIQIEFDAETRDLIVSWDGHEFTLGLINPDSIRKEPDLPDLDLPATVEFEAAGDLHAAIGFADDVSDHVRLKAYAEGGDRVFNVYAEGDTDSYDGEFVAGDEIRFEAFGEGSSLFSLDYLKDMRKPWDKDAPVTLDLGVEFPCAIRQSIATDDREVGEVEYMLAPRIQSD